MTLATPPILGDGAVPAGLLARAHGAARWLAARGVAEGSRIAVDAPGVPAWLLGADLLGAATLVVEPSWTPREREAVLADASPHLVVTGAAPPVADGVPRAAGDLPVADGVQRADGDILVTADVPRADRGTRGAGGVSPVGDDATIFYLPTTSGSSARPKVLMRTRGSWLRSFEALGRLPGPVLIPGPLSSSLFLFGTLHALWCGHEVRSLPRWAPEAAAEAAREAATVHLVPAMLSALLDVLDRRPDLRAGCALRTVVCGGAHLDPGARARFSRLLPGVELVDYYGSAEHSLIAVRRGEGGLRPVPGVRLDVRDGVLWVRSPLAFDGYLRDGVPWPVTGWSTVGDRVELDDTGALVVLGRLGATLSSGGKLVSAEEVEGVLRGVPYVTDVLVTGTPHPTLGSIVTAVVEATSGGRPTLRELRHAASANLEPGKRPRRWLVTTALPRTASGKPARATVAEQLRDGTLAAEPIR